MLFAADDDPSLMGVDNLFYNGKTQSCPIFTGCEKRIIDFIDDEVRDADAIIDDGEDRFFSS